MFNDIAITETIGKQTILFYMRYDIYLYIILYTTIAISLEDRKIKCHRFREKMSVVMPLSRNGDSNNIVSNAITRVLQRTLDDVLSVYEV